MLRRVGEVRRSNREPDWTGSVSELWAESWILSPRDGKAFCESASVCGANDWVMEWRPGYDRLWN